MMTEEKAALPHRQKVGFVDEDNNARRRPFAPMLYRPCCLGLNEQKCESAHCLCPVHFVPLRRGRVQIALNFF